MAQCGVPTAAWPFACGDVDLKNGLHWDDATNKFWVEPGLSTTATPLAWPYTASIDAANPTGNGLHYDAALCKAWVQPESNTNHSVADTVGAYSNAAGYLQDYNGPYGVTKAIWWSGSRTVLGARQFFNVVERNNCFITLSNTSSKNRRVIGDTFLPDLIHSMNNQLVQTALIATQWYEIYLTAGVPTGVWTQFGSTVQNFPFYTSPITYSTVIGAGFPWADHGDGLGPGGFPAWATGTGTASPFLSTGNGGALMKAESMGTIPYVTGVLAPGFSIRVALLIQGVSPFAPLFTVGPLPDVPYLAGYTQLTTPAKVNGVLI